MAKKADENSWAEVDRMVDEQRYELASEKVATILEAARAEGDDETVTRAMVKIVQLRLALHGPERAVLFLRESEAPDDPVSRLILGLVEAQALHQYLQTYGWKIRQREEITGDPDDLSLWTAERFQEEIQTLYAETWSRRETWGAEPLGEIGAWIQQNNYPPRIRGTLRDVVTYLWLDLLVDRSWWSPEHSNEIYRLDLETLLADAEPYRAADDENASDTLADPDVHPLRKVRLLLADLEAWHAAGDRPEAAFEARRRLVETLSHSFTEDEDRERLRAELEDRLDALGRSYPWWSMGMADLAEDHRRRDAESAPMALVRALEIARDGRRAHPDSVGGQRCRSIEAQIEAPSYALQAMGLDGPDRRSIEVSHKNVERLTFRAWSVDFAERVRTGRSTHPDAREVASLVGTQPAAEWSVDLPPTPDYRDHRTFVTPPLGKGSWVVAASARGDFADRGNLRLAVALQIADPVPTYRRLADGSVEITVHSGREGRPLEGVAIEIFAPYRGGRGGGTDEPATRLVTAEDGIARFEPAGDPRRRRGQQRFLYRHDGPNGAEVVVDERWIHNRNEYRQDEELVLVYTDRSVYRPGQTVQWKAVVYRRLFDNEEKLGEARRFAAKSGAKIEVSLHDANGEEVATTTGTTGEFGSLAGEFTLPTGRLLGYWNLRAADNGHAAIRVEEYKRPTFEVVIEDPEDALRLNREAVLQGEASYYFGLPVTDGRVRWRVERVPVWPTWWFWGRPSVDSQVVAAGEDALDEDGRFTVRFVPAADERLAESGEDGGATSRGLRQPWRDVSYRYRLSAEVTSEGGETREVDRSFRIGFVAVEARFERDAEFFRAGETARFTVRRTTLEGQPRAGEGAWRIVRLDQPASTPLPADLPVELRPQGAPATDASGEEDYETEGDTLRPRWQWGYDSSQILATWEDGAEVASGTLTHGEDGEATLEETLGAGAYRLHYTTTDEFGAELSRRDEFLVVGDAPVRLPAVLALAESSVEVGETARVLVHSGFADQVAVFEVWRGQERIERRALRFGSGDASTAPRILDVPITDKDRGGLRFRLVALRDHQLLEQERMLTVPWTDRRLEVAFETFRDELRPGREETWRVNVRRADGEPVGAEAAEVLAYMFDRSLDLFAEHDPLDPLAFYPDSNWAPPVESALGPARFVWRDQEAWAQVPGAPRLHGDHLQVFDGWPIGGPGMRSGPMRMQTMAFNDASPRAMVEQEVMVTAEMSPQVMMKTSSGVAAGDSAEALQNADEPPSESPGDEATAPLRENFAETAFFYPSLRTDADGGVSFEFTVPDSVTSWHVWVHALTRDLRGGRAHRETRTAKELLVRPQVPRFLREGDRAVLRVVVDNTGDEALSGTLDLDLRDPETDESLLAAFGLDATSAEGVAFTIEPKESTTLRFPLVAPRRVGPVSITVRGEADSWADGERRPLPILPSRLHLSRSRFAMLRGGEEGEGAEATRRLDFGVDDPRAEDPTLTHEAFVVTVEGQLFTSLLHALPYLVEYPYTCTEQTLNRYLSTGLLSRLYDDHPEIERLAATLAENRDTMLEVWEADDPNRRLLLEESPWLQQSRGGKAPQSLALLKVIDPEIAREQRRRSLAELEAAQLTSGAFPWWSGGPPSPWLTLYTLQGLARGLEAGLDVPQPMVQQAWKYLEGYWRNELDRELAEDAEDAECCLPRVVFFAWVLSSYPDDSWTDGVFTQDDRRRLLEIGFESWRKLSPRLKLHLALALDRGDRAEDARLLFESVMDSAVSDPDLGVYWQPEDRAWLWYRDTIETHAFALRAMMELEPEDPRRHGLAQWLLLEKKLSHWKSTRATAEALHALSLYLEREGTLGADQAVRVAWADASERNSERIVFEADDPDPRRQIVLEDEAVAPVFTEGDGVVEVTAEDAGFAIATATWHFATDRLPEAADGDLFAVERRFYRRVSTDDGHRLDPLADGTKIAVGDEIEVQLTLRARHAAEYVHLRDPRGAGFEPVDLTSGYQWRDGLALYREIRDSGTNFFVEWLPAGEVILRHRLRATVDGTFRVGPATVQSMYAPEFTAHSSGAELVIGGE